MTTTRAECVRTPENPEGLRDLPFVVARVTAAQKRRAREIDAALAERYPDAVCALRYSTPHELLIATILSAQTTDVNVNKATPRLFEDFPTPAHFASATPEQLEPYVRSLGFFRNKALAIQSAMASIATDFGGNVPRTMEELLTLRGVARKTANVVLGNAFGVNDGFVVDTHIQRLAQRFDLAPEGAGPAQVEKRLCALVPREHWCSLSHRFIAHGRTVCKARNWTCEQDAICRQFCVNGRARPRRARTSKAAANSKARGRKRGR